MKTLGVLPSAIAGAIPTLQWILEPASCPPLYFEPLDRMSEIRRNGTPFSPVTSSAVQEIVTDIPAAVDFLTTNIDSSSDASEEKRRHYFSLCSVALILLGHGYTDEAHDLVTPLSWPDETHFGYGSPVYSSIHPEALTMATYIHSLIHRREAFNLGEFGMRGFQNVNYWTKAAITSPAEESLPYRRIRETILRHAANGNSDGKKWCQERILDEGKELGDTTGDYWEPRALHELCGIILQNKANQGLKEFAELAAEAELRVLLGHALRGAGYESVGDCLRPDWDESRSTAMVVDESVALLAAKKVSSAHLDSFRKNGIITIRHVLPVSYNNEQLDGNAKVTSAAAGIAAILLGVPCVAQITKDSNDHGKHINEVGVKMLLSYTEEEAHTASQILSQLGSSSGGGSLSVGDLCAISITVDDKKHHDDDLFGPWYSFVACTHDDSRVTFVDRLYGLRGETPTTVIQWSKGTIF
jgi:hypothetical protein